MELNMWLIHSWLDQKNIRHFYTIEEDTPSFSRILLTAGETGDTQFPVLFDEPDSRQYASVLSFQNSRIYFRDLEASSASNTLNRLLQDFRKWQRDLLDLNLERKPLEDLLQEAGRYFPFPLLVCQDRNHIFSGANSEDFVTSFRNFIRHPDTEKAVQDFSMQKSLLYIDYPYLFTEGPQIQILADRFPVQERYVWIFADCRHKNVNAGHFLLMKILRKYIMQNVLFSHPGQTPNKRREAEDYLRSCITGAVPTGEAMLAAASILRWKADVFFSVFCLEYADKNDTFLLNVAQMHLQNVFPGSEVLLSGCCIYMFCDWGHLNESPENILLRTLPADCFYIGQSIPQKGLFNLPVLVKQALEAMQMARTRKQHYLSAQSMSTAAVYRKFYASEDIQSLVHPAILHLDKLDRENKHGFGYLQTLEIFLTQGANISAAARQMHLHRNTFISRIQKIKDLTGLSLEDETELEALLLSLLLYKNYNTASGRNNV